MNNSIPQVKTVKVLFVAMDEQQQAMFKMAFKMHSTTNYQVIVPDSAEKPELVIVDGDGPSGISAWQKAKGDYAGSVVVFFSKNPPTVTAPYLSKPIKFDTLFLSLRNLMQGNGVWVAYGGAGGGAPTSAGVQAPRPGVAPAHSASTAPTKPAAAAEPVAPTRATEVTIPRFDPRLGVLGKFRELLNQTKDAVILFENRPVLAIFPASQRVWVPDANALQTLCRQENPALVVKAISEESQIQERANATVTSCMWQVAVWTANGRLVHPLNPNTKFHLRYWPNLTRLAPLPEAMRLSAFLTKTTVSLNMLYKMMPLDMADILNYIAATYLIDYLVITEQVAEAQSASTTHAKVTTERPQRPAAPTRPAQANVRRDVNNNDDDDDDDDDYEPPKPKQSGGLLSRLMQKLLNK